ncbi:hypothetical protein [Paenibacillus flagellatus]|uniref:N-acetyltransferase domain-containing protein n=1 Tax=Paenibacillus flagellatus TaxID=2211139 RepID=A0A2V5KE55_9BACL|nr:hypothetical protein [Paenibacillus flagellatus]PYI56333.1 hypothetical protein DLM86_04965 [Paenibacillus flagellatus]
MLHWMTAGTEQMKEDGVLFICRHANDLGLPYKWSTTMNFLYTTLYDSGLMIARDEHGDVRGVLAYTYGTGMDKGADRTRIEVVLLYLEADFRLGTNFVQAMQAMVERESELSEPIREVEFYCAPTDVRRRLFGKIATCRGTKVHSCGPLDFYVTTPDRIRGYLARIAK